MHYDVADVDGKVSVSALKNDACIDTHSKNLQEAKQPAAQSSRDIVKEGEQKSRDEKCGAGENNRRQLPLIGGGLNSPWAVLAGAGVVAAGACLGLCHGDDPVSPAKA